MKLLNQAQLAQEGFTAIRNILEGRSEGGVELAKDIAEALHNIPTVPNEFAESMVCERLLKLQADYSDSQSVRTLASFVSPSSGEK